MCQTSQKIDKTFLDNGPSLNNSGFKSFGPKFYDVNFSMSKFFPQVKIKKINKNKIHQKSTFHD